MTAEASGQAYLVGGAVRDELLKLPVRERDWVVVGATADALLAQGFKPVGREFPVFLHPETGEEYALARQERKSGHGYGGFECRFDPSVTLEEDLLRRDLTINAIARREDGTLVDPHGGQRDLEARLLRHVSDAFVEDPLRVLRVARFAARFADLGFRIAPETLALMRTLSASGELGYLGAERIWQETRRALETTSPQVFFMTLRDCGALAILFPEIDHLFGVPQPPQWHPEIDTGLHLMLCLEQTAVMQLEPMTRFGVLVHDLGKGTTPPSQWPKHVGHEQRSAELCRALSHRLKVPAKWRAFGELVARHHTRCHGITQMKAPARVRLLEDLDAYRQPERFGQFLLACEADARGRTGREQEPYYAGEQLRRAFELTRMVSVRDLDDPTLQGAAIAEALHRLRCERLASQMRD